MNKTVDENVKYELPESCFVHMMKGVKIEKMDGKFLLICNPYPTIEGEMLLVQPKKDDQQEKDIVVVRDYSLRKRLPTQEAKQAGLTDTFGKKDKNKKKKKDKDTTGKL